MDRLHIMKSDRRCTKGQNAEFIMGSGRRRLSGNTLIKITAGGFANILNFQNHGRGLWEGREGKIWEAKPEKHRENRNIFRLLRIARDRKVKDLADELLVTPAYINAIEKGGPPAV